MLDLGAGCGGNSIFLAQKGFQVVAIDNRFSAIQCLKKEIKKLASGSGKVLPQKLDLAKELWPSKPYGVILALNFLHFLIHKRADFLISLMQESLKKQGVLFIRTFSHKNPHQPERYYPGPEILKQKFKGFEFLEFRHYKAEDDHPPLGRHTHWVIDLIVKKV